MAYHHGNARAALLDSAVELLETEGAAGLSLRQVAERAGLSRQAPYNHFADKEALLAEVAVAGFARLATSLEAVRTLPDPLEGIAATYIGFAQASPALFRLMFSKELVDLSRFPESRAAGAAAFGQLAAVVATLAPKEDVNDLSLAAWCIVHGYATLCIETGLEPDERRPARARLFSKLIRAAAAAESCPGPHSVS